MWVAALTKNRVWEQKPDAPRFREAFVTLAQTRRTWPAPADFMEALPPREQLAITKQPIKASQEAVDKACAELAKVLGQPKRQGANTGHGHVNPRPDGIKARCGGPGLCDQCSREAMHAAQERLA